MKTKNKLNWNDIVFEFKNKDYGAYFLRKVYNKDITIATSISLLILLLLIGPPFIMAKLNKSNSTEISKDQTVVFEGYRPDEVLPPPPPPPPPPVDDIKEKAIFKTPIVVDSVEIDIEILSNDQIIDSTKNKEVKDPEIVYVDKNKDPELPPEIPTNVQEMPTFPGGDEAMFLYINKNYKYPEISKENNMQGKIYVDFVVDENGKVIMVKIKRGIDQYMDKEAIRVVESMPDWSPGRQNGQAVKVKMNIPIKCTLYD